jgi:RNA polymerase sigma factor (sigma-70 family)
VIIRQLDRLFSQGSLTGSTEGELIERFVARNDESAFEALMARHGPMVLGVCRQLLHDPNDIDDAFQATFLVLVRKAGTLRRFDLLGNWLYGVAYRVAVRARSTAGRRMARFSSGAGAGDLLALTESRSGADPALADAVSREEFQRLHEEISHLPEKYRIPIVVCYIEGLTHEEASTRLGWSLGTVKGRLARARGLLRRRLSRRGVVFSLAALTSGLTTSELQAAVPASLQLATLNAAQEVVSHSGAPLLAASAISIPVAALAEGVLQTMILTQFKSIAIPLLLVASTVATGVVAGATRISGEGRKTTQTAEAALAVGRADEGAIPGDANQPVPKKESPHSAQPKGSPAALGVMDQRLEAERDAFEGLLAELRPGQSDFISRLADWSGLVLEADLVLSAKQADRVAAARAHRNRLVKLSDRLRAIMKGSDEPARRTQLATQIKEAEEWLESESKGSPVGPLYARNAPAAFMGGGMMEMMMRGRPSMTGKMVGPMARMMAGGRAAAVPREAPPADPTARDPRDENAVAPQPEAPSGAARGARGGQTDRSARPKRAARGAGVATMGGAGGMGAMMAGGPAAVGGAAGGSASEGSMGAMMGRSTDRFPGRDRLLRVGIAEESAALAANENNPRSQVTLKKLEEPIVMPFANATPLEDVLKYIKQATTTSTFAGIPIYVDPKAVAEEPSTLNSTITMDLEHIPLKTSLRLMLKQLGLAYCVRDGVVIISSVQGISEELAEARGELEAAGEQ